MKTRHAGKIRLPISLLVGFALAVPVSAQTPVIDPTAIARLREQLATANRTLNMATEQLNQVQAMRRTLGNFGRANITQILQMSGIDISGPNAVLNDVRALEMNLQNLQGALRATGRGGGGDMRQITRNFGSAQNWTRQTFYSSGRATEQEMNSIRTARNTMLREAGVASMALALSTKGDGTKTAQSYEGLARSISAATDLRGDIQANTSVMMSVLAEMQKQTAILAQDLELRAAQAISSDMRVTTIQQQQQ